MVEFFASQRHGRMLHQVPATSNRVAVNEAYRLGKPASTRPPDQHVGARLWGHPNSSAVGKPRGYISFMPDKAERLAKMIMDRAGTHAEGSFELLVSELHLLAGDPDLHQRVALEVIAAAGLSAPGTFERIVRRLRSRYPTDSDVDEFIAKVKRRVSLKTGKPIPHDRAVRK